MIDTHCHIDMYDKPIEIANECEKRGIITIGMTNLPSHFKIGYEHTRGYKNVRLALGMHPLMASEFKTEFDMFINLYNTTSYIGEVGLDFSRDGIETKDMQIQYFRKLLGLININNKKILSLHTRKAESQVFQLLEEYNVKYAIFHWYTGPVKLINEIINSGYYFSINPSMVQSKNGKKIINSIPKESVLTESDGPFIKMGNHNINPWDVQKVEAYLANIWQLSENETSTIIRNNFLKLIKNIK